MYHIFFIHPSVDERLGGFRVLDMINSASVNIGVHVSFFEFFKKIMYFWLYWVFFAVHGLSLVAASRGCSVVVVFRLHIAVASLVVDHGL